MFLQRLREYAEQMENLPPPMYQRVAVSYVIALDAEGRPQGVISRKPQKNKRGPEEMVPDLKRSVAISPKLLVDNAEYVLGIGRADSNPERVRQQHAAFVALVQDCVEQTGNGRVQAVLRFLTEFRDQLVLPDEFDPSENIMFEVEKRNPVNDPDVQRYWAKKAATGADALLMQCLVCGEMRPPVARLPISIKGIYGGPSSGMALISANAQAFESYGLEASLIAPTCEDCGQRFGNALNTLLKQDDTHLTVAPVVYIFWAREPLPFSVTSLLSQAEAQDVQAFLQAPWRGQPEAAQMQVSPFYAAVLSASGARVAVRDWLETTLDAAQTHLERYFQLQRLKDAKGEDRFLPLYRLARATINSKSQREDPPAQVVEALLHVAMHGGKLPDGVLYQVVRRVRSEGQVTDAHAAVIKMALLSQFVEEGNHNMDGIEPVASRKNGEHRIGAHAEDLTILDETITAPAYLCGRLLSVLESLQRVALDNKVNATIVDRYYGTASSAPASVFGRLMRNGQAHLGKLRRDKPGAFNRLDKQLQEIMGSLKAGFPTTLDMKQQALFALGYYHQKADDIRAGLAAKEARKQGKLSEADTGMEDLAGQ